MTKYTVAVNHFEYCDGLFETYKEAFQYAVKRTKEEFQDVADLADDEDVYYSTDGYFTVMEIVI